MVLFCFYLKLYLLIASFEQTKNRLILINEEKI